MSTLEIIKDNVKAFIFHPEFLKIKQEHKCPILNRSKQYGKLNDKNKKLVIFIIKSDVEPNF